MQQVKIFKSVEGELGALEETINGWVRESGARIVSITGNIAPQTVAPGTAMNTFSDSDVLIIVLYETEA
ncbi:hypothetical protein [Candidatus Laterigemmans baculatus]|uniref:hypothetical protein n=1 Tax=Candidatus Laterigemmans baculatus TaxID=2770505 RepID=UPI0013DCA94D|nr:hypothetical protein [Candidatus Laterigemmans baculatus]